MAERAVAGEQPILQSDRKFDWLGPGAYFWESDPKRAMEWAQWKASVGAYEEPTVVGAVIDLGNCLDLVSRADIELVREAHKSFVKLQQEAGLPVPSNGSPRGTKNKDRVLRFLDNAVLRHLHEMIDRLAEVDSTVEPFDTVRGMFVEGEKAFKGSGFYRQSHVQIAVRNPKCIKGVFFPTNSET